MGLTVTQADSGRTAQDAPAAGERGKRRVSIIASWGAAKSRRPTRPLGRPPYSPSFSLPVLGKPRFGLPWISLLLLKMPTAAPSRARFCLCGNRPGSPFVPRSGQDPPVRRARPGAVSREWRPGDLAHSRSLLLTRPMDSMRGIHRDHASGPHDLCNAVSVACDES